MTDVSNRSEAELPGRVLRLLRGIGTRAAIRAAMQARGYTEEEQLRGWKLLHAASGFIAPTAAPVKEDKDAQQAIAELDAWDEPNFRIAKATLRARFPAQLAFVFANLEASTGIDAALGILTFLDRLDALESSAARKSTKKEDHAALAALASRGIGEAERKHLRALLKTAQTAGAVPKADPNAAASLKKHDAALEELAIFYDEWSDIARVVITRRDYLILLGLAKRKTKKSATTTPASPATGATNGTTPGASGTSNATP